MAQSRPDAAHRGDGGARQVRHVLPGRRLRDRLRRASLDHRQVRAADPAGSACHGDEEARPRRHRVDDLCRALPCGARLRFARPYLRRARGLECRDHGLCQVECRVRPPASAPCRALRDGRGVRRSVPLAVGQLGRRCVHRRQEGRPVRPSRQPPCSELQGQVLHRRRRAQRTALAAGPSRADPGRLLRPRSGAGRTHRRRRLHGAERSRRGPGVLCRHEGAAPPAGPRRQRGVGHARRDARGRPHRARGP